jgi:hypothetical protein
MRHCFVEAVHGVTSWRNTACAKQWHTFMNNLGWPTVDCDSRATRWHVIPAASQAARDSGYVRREYVSAALSITSEGRSIDQQTILAIA